MSYGRFLPYSVVGTGLWATTFTLLGYFFWQSFDKVASIAGRATLAFGVLIAVVAGGVYAYRRLRRAEDRRRFGAWVDRQSRRPLLRPLAAVARPVWHRVLAPAARFTAPRARFLWHRLTPGGLGIELTTALAIAAVGWYVFLAYAVTLAGDPGPTIADREIRDFTGEVRMDAGVEVAKVVTALGDVEVVGTLVLVAVLALAFSRRPIELAVLLAGSLITWSLVLPVKDEVARARPPGDIVQTDTFAYPSGHAAYAVVYTVLAVIAARVLPDTFSRVAIVVGGVLVTAAVGASRVYLDVHWASDVTGGYALGAGVFGVLAIAGLVIGYVRNNDHAPGASGHADHG